MTFLDPETTVLADPNVYDVEIFTLGWVNTLIMAKPNLEDDISGIPTPLCPRIYASLRASFCGRGPKNLGGGTVIRW